jgi:PAS domain S-box-containing protein
MKTSPLVGSAKLTGSSDLQAELHLSEARFRTMFETSAVGIGMMTLDRKIIDANPAMCRMLGMSREELVGQTPKMATYPEDFIQSTAEFEQLLSGEKDYFWTERRYVRKNGEIFWAHVTMSTVRGPDGKPLFMVGMVIDIDERKRAALELRKSEERFRAIYNYAEMGIVIANLDENIGSSLDDHQFHDLIAHQRVNPALQRMFGYSEAELQNMDISSLIYPADRNLDAELSRQLFAGERDSYRIEKRYVRKDDSIFWGRLNYSLVRSVDGKPQMAIGIIEDIDQEKQAQERLRESEARFRAMFENTSVGIALTTLDRRLVQINDAAVRLTGYPGDEILSIHPVDLAISEDHDVGEVEFQELLAGERSDYSMEKRYQRKDGSIFWGRVTYSVVPDEHGKPEYLIGMIEDVTQEKEARQKLQDQEREYRETLEQRVEERTRALTETNLRLVAEIEQRQRAEEALAAKAAEEAIVSERTRLARELHDAVTQTLFSASLIAEVLPELWKIDPQEAQKTTEELRQLTRGALAEMRTLLLELRPAALLQARFQDLVKQLVEAVVGRTRLPVNLDIVGEDQLSPEVQVALYRIAQESLNNIVKYARATHVDIRLRLSCCHIEFDVSDNGIGFDMTKIKPTSLGLRIMHERAEAIGADLRITSSPGKGTQVRVVWDEEDAGNHPL